MRQVTLRELCDMPEGTIFGHKMAVGPWSGPNRLVGVERNDSGILDALFSLLSPGWDGELGRLAIGLELSFGKPADMDWPCVVYEPADIDAVLHLLGFPPASVIQDLMRDGEGITAQMEYRRGKREGVAEEREACAQVVDEKADEMLASMAKAAEPVALAVRAGGAAIAQQVAELIRSRGDA